MNPAMAVQLERIMSKAKKVPNPTTICRCGSSWRNGKEESLGWVFVSDKGRSLVRRCEQCNSVRPVAPGMRGRDFTA